MAQSLPNALASVLWALAMGVCALGCDADSDGRIAADQVDVGDAEIAREVIEEVASPAAALEQVVSVAGEARGARDDLFCDLSGDDLVWVQLWLDLSVTGATADTDCTTCPYCAGCRFDFMYRRLPAGRAELLHSSSYAQAGPQVGNGVATWVGEGGETYMRDLARGETKVVPSPAWVSAAPVVHGNNLWWWGYDNAVGSYSFSAYDRTSGLVESGPATYVNDPSAYTSAPLAGLARRQPFTVSDDGIWYTRWDGTPALVLWRFGGTPEVVFDATDRIHLRALPQSDGGIVTLGYESNACEASTCGLGFTAYAGDQGHIDGSGESLAADAVPSRYVAPVADGDRIVWVDHRDGPYAIYGVGPTGDERRLTSDAAEIGAVSTIAASNGRVVWADRRSGRWRIMARAW